jgi:hypothetical protein
MAAICGAISAAGSSNDSLPGWNGSVFARLQWKRRLLICWDYASNFLGFVQLASITMLLKQF